MHTGLKGGVFGGTIARVMGHGVAPHKERILHSIADTARTADARWAARLTFTGTST